MPPAVCEPAEADVVAIYAEGCSATVHRLGATVVSWTVGGEEKLFVSSRAVWDGSKPIRGGIPLVFRTATVPHQDALTLLAQFGTGPIMSGQHGFARSSTWSLAKTSRSQLVCTLRDNEATLAVWPFHFELTYTVTLGSQSLKSELQVRNCDAGHRSFPFTALLHTYFFAGDVSSVEIAGLENLAYRDKLLGGAESRETGRVVRIGGEVDRTYLDAPSPIRLSSQEGTLSIATSAFTDYVVWNPWVEKSKTMADFADEEYRQMVCIEAGVVGTAVSLTPGECWRAAQVLTVEVGRVADL